MVKITSHPVTVYAYDKKTNKLLFSLGAKNTDLKDKWEFLIYHIKERS